MANPENCIGLKYIKIWNVILQLIWDFYEKPYYELSIKNFTQIIIS